MTNKQQQVIDAFLSERKYQEQKKKDDNSHVVEDFPLGSALTAIEHNLTLAKSTWYNGLEPHPDTMEFLRKIGAICMQMGEVKGMPKRKLQ